MNETTTVRILGGETLFVLAEWTDGPRISALDLGPVGSIGWHAIGVTQRELEGFIRTAAMVDPNGTWAGCEVMDDVNGLIVSDGNDPEDSDLDMFLARLTVEEVEEAGGVPAENAPWFHFAEWSFVRLDSVEEV